MRGMWGGILSLPVFAVAAVGTCLGACATANHQGLYRTPYAWQHGSDDARSVMEESSPDVVRVTTTDSIRFVLEDAQLVADSIVGTAVWEDDSPPQPEYRLAVRDVGKIEWRTGRSGSGPDVGGFLKGMGVLLGVAVLVGAVALGAL